ncbi:TPA: phage tail protein [Klebsiella pneumoniae]|nr:phage tail protein [Klebsiella pneumoniae]
MSQTVITSAFEQLKAQEAANGGVVILDEFVFANIPNLDITSPIDRGEGLPEEAMIVHRQAVGKTGMVNNNAVVYSVVMGADVGDFEFNWVGLVNKANNVVAMIVHAPMQKKIKTATGQQGNVLTRSFLMEYNGASEQTRIITPADTWQIDFTARLGGVDERIRCENIDIYGEASFFGDGFLVSKNGSQCVVKKGVGYIAGVRAELLFDQTVTVDQKPVKIWADVSWKGTLTSIWASSVKLTIAESLSDYHDNDEQHYVFAIAAINADGTVLDLRPSGFSLKELGSNNKGSGSSYLGIYPAGTVQNLVTFLSFDMFNIKNDASEDVTQAIIDVFNYSNDLGIPVVQKSGRYLISGNTFATSTAGFDLDGATFVPSANFTGYLLGTQSELPVTYDSSSAVVSAINNVPISPGDSILKGLKNTSVLNGHAVFIRGADPLYVARGKTKYWWHNTRISNRGKMDDRMKYGVSSVNEVIALPVKKKITEFRLPAWDFINGPSNNGVMRFNNITRARIYGGAIYNRPLQDNEKNPVIISLNYCYDISVEDLYDEYPSYPVVGGQIAYAYTLNFNYVNRLSFKNCCAQGYGWGVVGGQLATNLSYKECNLNRIDMHDPFMGTLNAEDCSVGCWGFSVFGMGDMHISRITVDLDDSFYGGYREIAGIFNTRPDFSGVFDGNIYINGLTIVGDASAYRESTGHGVSLFSAYSYNGGLGYIPEGSPVEPWGFREIIVKGLNCVDPIQGRRFDSIIKADSVQQTTYFPLRVKIEDARFNSTEPECIDLHGWRVPAYNKESVNITHTLNYKPTNFIEMNDVSLAGLEVIRPYLNYDYHNIDFKMRNARNTENTNSPIAFYTDQCGRYEFSSCALRKISDRTYSTGNLLNRNSTFVVNGGVFNSLSGLPFDITFNSGYNTPVLASNVLFVGLYSQTSVTAINANLAEFSVCENCKYFSNETVGYISPALWLGSAGANGISTSFNVARENNLNLAFNVSAGGNSETLINTVKMPGSVAPGNVGGTIFSSATGSRVDFQLSLNSRGLKANVGKVMSSGTLTGIYLQ